MSDIFAILMASGFSRRFGGNKLLVPFRGKPLARHTLDLACSLSGRFSGIFFITADDSVAALAGDLPVTVIRNTAPEKGQRESIRLGVEAAERAASGKAEIPDEALPEDSENGVYYLFFPCDQPLLDAETVERIIGARQPHCIVEPRFQNKPGNPCLFSDSFREELLALKEGEHPRDIKVRHPEALIPLEARNPLAFRDIDDPEDLKN
jgi:molybdenum cofactor cytidylyltransferase